MPSLPKVHPSATRPSSLWRDPPLSAPSSRRVWLFRVSQYHQFPYQEILSMSSKQYSFLTLPLTSLNQIFIHILAFLLNPEIGWGLRNLNLDLLVYPILIKCGIYTSSPTNWIVFQIPNSEVPCQSKFGWYCLRNTNK